MHGEVLLQSVEGQVGRGPRDPAAFRAEVLRRAMRIERRRAVVHAGGWALGVLAVTASVLVLVRPPSQDRSAGAPPVLPVTRFEVHGGDPVAITAGSDGNLWVAVQGPVARVAQFSPTGRETSFALPEGAEPAGVVAGADGAVWFSDPGRSAIGRISRSGVIREFPTPARPGVSITSAGDGSIWFTEPARDRIAKMGLDGRINEVRLPPGASPTVITAGPDAGIWFGEAGAPVLGRVAATGALSAIALADPAERVTAVAVGPGPALWFLAASPGVVRVGHVDTAGRAAEQVVTATSPTVIGLGPDGRLWLAGPSGPTVALATQTRLISRRLSADTRIVAFAAGPDNNMWFVEPGHAGFIESP